MKKPYPLRTTEPASIESELDELVDLSHPRKAVWTHVESEVQRSGLIRRVGLIGDELRILRCLPCWFVVVVNSKKISTGEAARLTRSILASQRLGDIIFRGHMFGYDSTSVTWYRMEVLHALNRFENSVRPEDLYEPRLRAEGL